MIPTRTRDATIPAGEVLVSVARRAAAFVIDLGMIGLPLLLGAVDMMRGGTELSDTARDWLAIEAAVMTVAYHGLAVRWFGRTIGKAVMQCRVVRSDTGGRVSWSAALLRASILALAVARPELAVPALVLVHGWAVFDPRQQGLHDRAAGTIVVLD